MTSRRRHMIASVFGLIVLLYVSSAHGQGTDGPTSVVMTTPTAADAGWSEALGNITWPGAAYGVVYRFLSVLERMVTDTRGWLDRWLDKTGGKLKIDFKKTIVSAGWVETDPDRTGPVPAHNRRSTDRGRNGTAPHEEDEATPQ